MWPLCCNADSAALELCRSSRYALWMPAAMENEQGPLGGIRGPLPRNRAPLGARVCEGEGEISAASRSRFSFPKSDAPRIYAL